MKNKFFCLALVSFLFLFSSCSAEYCDNVSSAKIASAISENIENSEFSEYPDVHYYLIFGDDERNYDDATIIYSDDINDISEFGIFHSKDKKAAQEVFKDVCEYIDDFKETQRGFIMSYAPGETKKLDGAWVKMYGNYVIYGICSTEERSLSENSIKNLIGN